MSEAVVIAIISGIALNAAAIIAGVFAILNKQEETFHAVNGRMDELLELTRQKSEAIGRDEEREREK